jgi:hypothetical protein
MPDRDTVTRALDAAVDAFHGAGWSTDDKNMREAVRAYLDALDPADIRAALNDPGRFTPRDDDFQETLADWQRRALMEGGAAVTHNSRCASCGLPLHRYSPNHTGSGTDLMGCINSMRPLLDEAVAERDALRDAIRRVPHEDRCLAFENPAHERDCSCGIGEWKAAALAGTPEFPAASSSEGDAKPAQNSAGTQEDVTP